ncbi:hypothetical protein SPB21_03890 [Leptothoe sp. ISB3NOV94-8A]
MNRKPVISIIPFEKSNKENQQQCVDAMNYLAGTIKHSHPDLFEQLDSLQSEITKRLGLAE